MENNIQNNQNQFQEEEIDIMAIVRRLWEKKTFIIKVTCVFAVLGVIVALTTPKEYTASCVVVPETKGGAFSSSSLGGLAAMAGINLGASSGGEMLSPFMYDKLMNNINFRKELMHTPISWEGYEEPITILDYYTKPEYVKASFLKTIKKYTLGLPFLILNTISDKSNQSDSGILPRNIAKISSYSKEESMCISILATQFSIVTNKKNGDVTIITRMPQPIAAAQLAEAVKDLLQKYVIELKLQKAEINYNYIKQRYDEAKIVFEEKQADYAKFQDANKVLSTALSKAKEEQIRNEFTVAKDLFYQLTTQLVQAEMKVKEDIPILTVLEPVQLPLEKSAPKRLQILMIWSLVGGIFGCALIFCQIWLEEFEFKHTVIFKILKKII